MRIVRTRSRREDGWAASTVAIVMGVVAAAGAATSAVGAYSAGQQKEAADKYNAQVSENNAAMLQQQAAAESERVKDRGRRIMASQRAALSAAGVDIDSGSSVDLGYDSSIQSELDRLTTLYRGNIGATSESAQAGLYRQSARDARIGGALGAGGTLLGGLAQAGATYYSVRNNPRMQGEG